MDAVTFVIPQFKCIPLALQTDERGIFCDKQRCAEQTIRQEAVVVVGEGREGRWRRLRGQSAQ